MAAVVMGGLGVVVYLYVYVSHRITHLHRMEDFFYFFAAAQAIDHGKNPYAAIGEGIPRAGYIYPPLLAFLYWPLAHFFKITMAAQIALVVNLLALCGGLVLGARTMLERFGENLKAQWAWGWIAIVAVGSLVLTFDKVKGEIQMMQTNVLVLASLLAALYFLDRLPLVAGAALGFALNIKYQALLMLPYLLLRRRWKAAGWMALWTAFWALLLAVKVGWGKDFEYLSIAFGGILKLVGISPGTGMTASIDSLTSRMSVSITSAVARGMAGHKWAINPIILTALIALLWLALLAGMYARHKLPLLKWPAAMEQQANPLFRNLVAIEWMILVAATLCFSPQTNTRHLFSTAIVDLSALAFLATRRREKISWTVVAGIWILLAGLTLPPGNRTPVNPAETGPQDTVQNMPVRVWHGVGGPAWSLLLATTLIAWSQLAACGAARRRLIENN